MFTLLSCVTGFSAPFINLDFEQANTNGLYSYFGTTVGSIEDLLPGWQVIASRPYPPPLGYTNSLQFVTFDDAFFDEVNVGVVDYDPLQVPRWPKIGKYSLFVSPLNGSVSVSQRGDMPSNARGLVLEGALASPSGPWTVSLTETSQGRHWTNRGVVGPFIPFPAEFAGENVELRVDFSSGTTEWRIDAVRLAPALQMLRNQDGDLRLAVSLGLVPQVLQKAPSVVGPWSDWQSVPEASADGAGYPGAMTNYPVTPEASLSLFRLILSGGSP
jgi:hypothetical protein